MAAIDAAGAAAEAAADAAAAFAAGPESTDEQKEAEHRENLIVAQENVRALLREHRENLEVTQLSGLSGNRAVYIVTSGSVGCQPFHRDFIDHSS